MPENPKTKKRLDQIVLDRGLAEDIQKARSLILSGSILVNDSVETRVGYSVLTNSDIRKKEVIKDYVSRGAFKLLGAFDAFPDFSVDKKLAFDLGASTGGFTQVLLEKGASKVVAIDVGYGQLATKLLHDERVVVWDRFHTKDLTSQLIMKEFPDSQEFIFTMDLSFMSIDPLLKQLSNISKKSQGKKFSGIALIKPQFETKSKEKLEKGILRDKKEQGKILMRIMRHFRKECEGKILGLARSPILGREGNQEYLFYFSW